MSNDRRSAILSLVIEHYIRTGEPIGSKTLTELLPYAVSSATIRNEMAYLSDLGYLIQRHTSGGRVPTKTSYRYYVDNLMDEKSLNPWEIEKINQTLSTNASDPIRLLEDASKLLAEETGCAAFYSTVKDPLEAIQKLEIIPVGNQKVLLSMISTGGKIKSSVCKVSCEINEDFIRLFHILSNEFFVGTPLSEVSVPLIQSTVQVLGSKIFDVLPILSSLIVICNEASDGIVEICGQTNLLRQKELGEDLYRILELTAQKDKLDKLLTSFTKAPAQCAFFIGDENPMYELKNTIMGISQFTYNETQKATLGIIGSLRIDYNAVLPRLRYISQRVAELLKEGGPKYE